MQRRKPAKPPEVPPAERKMIAAYMAVRDVEIMDRYRPSGYDVTAVRVGKQPIEEQ